MEVSKIDTPIIMLGDKNLCAAKWNEPDFKSNQMADEVKSTLAQCGLKIIDLGHTYLADRLSEDGLPIQSSLDHIYQSIELEDKSVGLKLDNSSTDQGAASLTVTAKSSFRRHFYFNDVCRHRHQLLLMTPFVTVIVIWRHLLSSSSSFFHPFFYHFNL